MVDFSTVRIGTQFDNWIQFIEDPKGKFSCSQEELIQLFFKKIIWKKKELKFFYSASIYTNLLQGIFTYKKNPQLAMEYFRKVNYSYIKLTGENNILVDTSALI